MDKPYMTTDIIFDECEEAAPIFAGAHYIDQRGVVVESVALANNRAIDIHVRCAKCCYSKLQGEKGGKTSRKNRCMLRHLGPVDVNKALCIDTYFMEARDE